MVARRPLRHRRTAIVALSACAALLGLPATASACTGSSGVAVVNVTKVILTGGCFDEDLTSYTASPLAPGAMASVNGLPIPVSGSLKLLKASGADPGGRLQTTTTEITLNSPLGELVTIDGSTIDWALPQETDEGPVADDEGLVGFDAGGSLLGFDLEAALTLRFGRTQAGAFYSKVGFTVKTPPIFTTVPSVHDVGSVGGALYRQDNASGQLVVRILEDGTMNVDTAKIDIPFAYFGRIQLRNVCFSYISSTSQSAPCPVPPAYPDQIPFSCDNSGSGPPANPIDTGSGHWDGGGSLVLPNRGVGENPPRKPPLPAQSMLTLAMGMDSGADPQFRYAFGGFSFGDNYPIGTSLFLDHISLGFCTDPHFYIRGDIGIRFGKVLYGHRIAALDGQVEWGSPDQISIKGKTIAGVTIGDSWDLDPPDSVLAVYARLRILDLLTLSQGFFTLDMPGYAVNFGAEIDATAIDGLVGFHAGFAGYLDIDKGYFALSGEGELCLFLCASAEAIISDVGWSACAELTGFLRFGVGQRWGEDLETFGSSCDTGRYKSVGQTGLQSVTVHVPAHRPGVQLHVSGVPDATSGKFDFRVTSPSGDRQFIVTGPKYFDRTGWQGGPNYAFTRSQDGKDVDLMIVDPEGGDWTVERWEGRLREVLEADVAPLPIVTGTVTGYARNRTLNYTYPLFTPTTGDLHNIKWHDVGLGDNVIGGTDLQHDQPCGTVVVDGFSAVKMCGHLDFVVPESSRAGVRTIKAIVTTAQVDSRTGNTVNVPTDIQDVATYVAPVPVPPSRAPWIRLRRVDNKVVITWGAATNATGGYQLDGDLSDGRTFSTVVAQDGDRTFTLYQVPWDTTVKGTLTSLGDNGTQKSRIFALGKKAIPEDIS